MTDNEKIKAFEYCSSHDDCDSNCPIAKETTEDEGCIRTIGRLALDIINRLKAENERYREVVGKLAVAEDGTVTGFLNGKETKFIDKAVAETFKSFAVSSARKEFAERLKEEIIKENDLYVRCVKNMLSEDFQRGYEEKNDSIVALLDNLLAEMESERE